MKTLANLKLEGKILDDKKMVIIKGGGYGLCHYLCGDGREYTIPYGYCDGSFNPCGGSYSGCFCDY